MFTVNLYEAFPALTAEQRVLVEAVAVQIRDLVNGLGDELGFAALALVDADGKGYQPQADGTVRIELDDPVKLPDGVSILKHITLRPPKVKDIKAASKVASTAEEREVVLLARLAGSIVPEDLDELGWADYQRLQSAFRFLGRRKPHPGGPSAAGAVVPVPTV